MSNTKVAVMNSSQEVTTMLTAVIESAGFETCDIFTYKFKYGKVSFEDFIKKNKPDIILYDIAVPYEENYKLFLSLSQNMASSNIPIVLTTTNKQALEKLVGDTGAHEIIGKPFDLDELINLITKASVSVEKISNTL